MTHPCCFADASAPAAAVAAVVTVICRRRVFQIHGWNGCGIRRDHGEGNKSVKSVVAAETGIF